MTEQITKAAIAVMLLAVFFSAAAIILGASNWS